MLAMIPFLIIANPSQPRTLAEVLNDAMTKPVAYGHGGNGSAMHLSGELLKMMTNTPLIAVAYKGSGPVATDVLGGQVPLGIVDVPSAIANVKAGKIRALAVTTKQRISAMPDVPTFEEAGVKGYESIGWFGAVAPASTPPEVIGRLNREIAAALAAPDVREKAIAAGCEPAANSPQEFAAFVRDEARKWADVIQKAGVKIQ
jgi:tripartite-type tricarboxylate transporter receptor subunit TctC